MIGTYEGYTKCFSEMQWPKTDYYHTKCFGGTYYGENGFESLCVGCPDCPYFCLNKPHLCTFIQHDKY